MRRLSECRVVQIAACCRRHRRAPQPVEDRVAHRLRWSPGRPRYVRRRRRSTQLGVARALQDRDRCRSCTTCVVGAVARPRVHHRLQARGRTAWSGCPGAARTSAARQITQAPDHRRRGVVARMLDRGGHGAVGDVVVPAVVAPEVADAVAGGEADLPKPPSTSRWFASSLRISPSGTVDRVAPRTGSRRCRTACCWLGPVSVRAPGSIVRSPAASVLPRPGMGRLLVDQMHGPGDLGFGIGDLLDRAVVVVGEDAEARRLTLDPALRILEAARRRRTARRGARDR